MKDKDNPWEKPDVDMRFRADWSVTVSPRSQTNTPSTLLIPAALMPLLYKERCTCPLAATLDRLLCKYRGMTLCKLLPVAEKCKTQYQDAGLDLKRVNFRPDNKSWLELGLLARAFGISRCMLFVCLYMMYVGNSAESSDGVPTDREGRYDMLNPEYMEYSEKLYINTWNPCKYVRRLRTKTLPWEKKRYRLCWFV